MNLIIHQSITVESSAVRVWKALTDNALNEKYLSGIIAVNKFSQLQGKILDIFSDKLLHNLPASGDGVEKNSISFYHVTYILELEDNTTTIRISHKNIENHQRAKTISEAWRIFLLEVKKKLDA